MLLSQKSTPTDLTDIWTQTCVDGFMSGQPPLFQEWFSTGTLVHALLRWTYISKIQNGSLFERGNLNLHRYKQQFSLLDIQFITICCNIFSTLNMPKPPLWKLSNLYKVSSWDVLLHATEISEYMCRILVESNT